jgi:hypothetical protein
MQERNIRGASTQGSGTFCGAAGKSNVDVFKYVDCSPGTHNLPVLLVDS